jgi:hypothetical protein
MAHDVATMSPHRRRRVTYCYAESLNAAGFEPSLITWETDQVRVGGREGVEMEFFGVGS